MTDSADARAKWEWNLARLHYFCWDSRYGQACADECSQMRDVISSYIRAQASQVEEANATRVLAELKLAEASQTIRDLKARLAEVEGALPPGIETR